MGLIVTQITAVGYDRLWKWPVVVIVGYGFVGVQMVSISAIVIAVSPHSSLISSPPRVIINLLITLAVCSRLLQTHPRSNHGHRHCLQKHLWLRHDLLF
jgi:hypothetical protein